MKNNPKGSASTRALAHTPFSQIIFAHSDCYCKSMSHQTFGAAAVERKRSYEYLFCHFCSDNNNDNKKP